MEDLVKIPLGWLTLLFPSDCTIRYCHQTITSRAGGFPTRHADGAPPAADYIFQTNLLISLRMAVRLRHDGTTF